MSVSEIIQIVLSSLSLIATVAVSVIIYKFERMRNLEKRN